MNPAVERKIYLIYPQIMEILLTSQHLLQPIPDIQV